MVRFALVAGLLTAVGVLRVALVDRHEHCICGACCRHGFNDVAAMATLKNLWSAEDQFLKAKACDEDGDGRGEAGGFAELSGAVGVRGGEKAEPVLASHFASLKYGCVERHGYYYRIFLPAAQGGLVGEQEAGAFRKGVVDPKRASLSWCAYAWPVREEYRFQRTFFLSSEGDVLATTGYAAADAPNPDAALDTKGRPAVDATGTDGNLWKQTG